jgi:hypothetical protein
MRSMIVLTATALLIAVPVAADWDVGDPHKMHWPQLPDLTPDGLDVYATTAGITPGAPPLQKYLADDWRCSQTGPVTDLHIWGSWLNDVIPQNPSGTHGTFQLGIWSDIPASQSPTGYSMPGDLLWTRDFVPGTYMNRFYATAPEQFYDPNIGQIIGVDTQVWQYNFLIDPAEAFFQEVDTIYWLSVTHFDPDENGIVDPEDLDFIFGWKSARPEDRFNDDAVFGDAFLEPFPVISGWGELRYPSVHPLGGESMDLAFVITPEPLTLTLLLLGAAGFMRRR